MASEPDSASISREGAAVHVESQPLSPNRPGGLEPLHASMGSKQSAYPCESDNNAHFHEKNTDSGPIDLGTAEAHTVEVLPLAQKLPSMLRVEENSIECSELAQIELPTTNPSRSLCYRQLEKPSTSSVPSNHLDSSAPPNQETTPRTPSDDHNHGNLPFSKTVPPTEDAFNPSPSETPKQKAKTLLELPFELLCLVAENLDIVTRNCLKYAHPAFGCFCREGELGSLSICEISRLSRLFRKDRASFPKELALIRAKKGFQEGECFLYHGETGGLKYCVICRCNGHLARCPRCRVRTCAREDTEFWRKWTRFVDDETLLPAANVHPSP